MYILEENTFIELTKGQSIVEIFYLVCPVGRGVGMAPVREVQKTWPHLLDEMITLSVLTIHTNPSQKHTFPMMYSPSSVCISGLLMKTSCCNPSS
jgi:hypothetical protein